MIDAVRAKLELPRYYQLSLKLRKYWEGKEIFDFTLSQALNIVNGKYLEEMHPLSFTKDQNPFYTIFN